MIHMESWWTKFFEENILSTFLNIEQLAKEKYITDLAITASNWIGSDTENLAFEEYVSFVLESSSPIEGQLFNGLQESIEYFDVRIRCIHALTLHMLETYKQGNKLLSENGIQEQIINQPDIDIIAQYDDLRFLRINENLLSEDFFIFHKTTWFNLYNISAQNNFEILLESIVNMLHEIVSTSIVSLSTANLSIQYSKVLGFEDFLLSFLH